MSEPNIQWTNNDGVKKEHGPDWFWTVSAIAIAIAAGSIILDNILLAALIIIATIALLLQTAKKPSRINFSISDRGIHVGNVLYPYQDLDSFSITEKNILIKSKKRLMPFLTIPISEKKRSDIYEILYAYLPEENHTEPVADKIMEGLGF